MKPYNVLFLFSDEHRSDAMGCDNHPLVKTPHLDSLAAQGCRFANAYTPSPICVPARAALATGEYVHQTRCWSNAQAYQGEPNSFGHALQQRGHRVDSIGKLHYRGSEYANGFDNEILPLYIKNGTGWIKGLLRDHEFRFDCKSYVDEIGPGSDSYTDFDLGVTRNACEWLTNMESNPDKPWTLFVSWLRPHYPLTCPEAFFNLYPIADMDQARFTDESQLPKHPVLKTIKKHFNYDEYFNEETRQIARASYYGLCSFLDHQIGQVLNALEQTGQTDNTIIIYSSDHGDHNGDRRMWTKMSLYDESAKVPLIIKGPGIPANSQCMTISSLIDIYPTILSAILPDEPELYADKPGISLQTLANHPEFDRPILSEYHDGGSPTGMFMLRNARWKYNVYPGFDCELFDMEKDSAELVNLASDPAYSEIKAICHEQMLTITNPEQANNQAFVDQAQMIESLGGVEAIANSDEFDFTPVETN